MLIIFSANNSFRTVPDYESCIFFKYSCKILRYLCLEGMGTGRGGEYGRPAYYLCYTTYNYVTHSIDKCTQIQQIEIID